eukprot:scaffold96868_cov16-Prasinocladus_malaysianus.AAC.1
MSIVFPCQGSGEYHDDTKRRLHWVGLIATSISFNRVSVGSYVKLCNIVMAAVLRLPDTLQTLIESVKLPKSE